MEWFKYSGISDCSNSGSQGFSFNVVVTGLHDVNIARSFLPMSVPKNCWLIRKIPEDRDCCNEAALSEIKLFPAR